MAVIGDLVGSRAAPSRAEAQRALLSALGVAADVVSAEQPPAPTIGDEFQAVYATPSAALRAALVVRLALPAPMDCRCGIGAGPIEVVGTSDYGLTQDGPAWWAARAAIDEVGRREHGRHPALRTWYVDDNAEVGPINAYLLARDELVSALDDRQRRLVLGLLRGATQKDLARAEGISASAVSQSLRRCGAWSLIDGLRLWETGA